MKCALLFLVALAVCCAATPVSPLVSVLSRQRGELMPLTLTAKARRGAAALTADGPLIPASQAQNSVQQGQGSPLVAGQVGQTQNGLRGGTVVLPATAQQKPQRPKKRPPPQAPSGGKGASSPAAGNSTQDTATFTPLGGKSGPLAANGNVSSTKANDPKANPGVGRKEAEARRGRHPNKA